MTHRQCDSFSELWLLLHGETKRHRDSLSRETTWHRHPKQNRSSVCTENRLKGCRTHGRGGRRSSREGKITVENLTGGVIQDRLPKWSHWDLVMEYYGMWNWNSTQRDHGWQNTQTWAERRRNSHEHSQNRGLETQRGSRYSLFTLILQWHVHLHIWQLSTYKSYLKPWAWMPFCKREVSAGRKIVVRDLNSLTFQNLDFEKMSKEL